MTHNQMAELAALLRLRARLFRAAEPGSVIAGDMIRAADLIDSMAQRRPLTDEQVFADDGIMAANARIGIPLSGIMELARAIEKAHGIRSEK